MALRGSNTAVKKNDLRREAWAIVILAVTIAGYAVSGKTPSSNYVAEASASQQNVQTVANGEEPVLDNSDSSSAVDDFELLEDELVEQMVTVADPLEPWNRMMYQMNDKLYFWLIKPVTQAYKDVTPEPARVGIRNFFQNLQTPVRLVNCLLQGKGDAAGTELRRFAINTTAGVLGFGDPALDELGLLPAREDMGQTLAIYGLDNCFYIVWPFMGPSTVRDSVGMVGDYFLNPTRYMERTDAYIGVSVLGGINASSFRIGSYEALKSEALEPYVVMRESYIQYRNKQIQD